MQPGDVKHYSEHYQETLRVRKATGDRSAVAESLRKYQSAKEWPNSQQPLPPDLQRALQRRKWLTFEVRACWLFLSLCFLGLVASLFGGPFLFREGSSLLPIPDFSAKAPLLTGACAAIFFFLFWLSLAVLSRLRDSHSHLEALHFMYLCDVLPHTPVALHTYREPKFEVKLEGRVYTMFENGETDVTDDSLDVGSNLQ